MTEGPPPTIDVPPELGPEAAATAERFLIRGAHANLWFEGGSDVLIVSFDNLATIDEGWPRGPWAWGRLQPLGYAVLGVQSHAKDWFRQPTAPELLRALEVTGFFSRFRRVVFIGASMGGFAALNLAPLVPGARVLAFSPQSTMNKTIAPFETRFPFAVKRSNWEGMPFLDAAAAVPYLPRAMIVYDPFVSEDRAHAKRLSGADVEAVRVPFCTHEAIRVILKSGTFPLLLAAIVGDAPVGHAFWTAFRARRGVPKWQRALLAEATRRGRPHLVICAARALLDRAGDVPDADLVFIRRARRAATQALAASVKGAGAGCAPKQAGG